MRLAVAKNKKTLKFYPSDLMRQMLRFDVTKKPFYLVG